VPDIDPELAKLLKAMEDHLNRNMPASELADAFGLKRGVSGYIYHTVPLALYCWLRQPGDFIRAIEEVICLGGDADTTGAVTGALVGATVGGRGIPNHLIDSLIEWPRGDAWMRLLAARLAESLAEDGKARPLSPPPYFWPGVLPRNLFFLCVVLGHGFRRLLPPY
jgi:ADP-ribosylglycohydrolase